MAWIFIIFALGFSQVSSATSLPLRCSSFGPSTLEGRLVTSFENYLNAVNPGWDDQQEEEAMEMAPFCFLDLAPVRDDLERELNSAPVPPFAAEEEAWARSVIGTPIRQSMSQDEACRLDGQLEALETALAPDSSRLQLIDSFLNDLENSLRTLKAEVNFHNVRTPFFRCLDRVAPNGFFDSDGSPLSRSYQDAMDRCGQSIGNISADLDLLRAGAVKAAGLGCLFDEEMDNEVEKNMHLAKELEAHNAKILRQGRAYLERQRKNNPIRLRQAAAKRVSLKKWNCEDWKAKREALLKESIPMLEAEESRGTGFYLRSGPNGDKRELLTAHHVGFYFDRPGMQEKSLEVSNGSSPGKSFTFERKPGSFNYTEDVIKTPVQENVLAFRAAEETYRPQLGEAVTLSGYPGIRGESFASYRCTFIGVGNSSASGGGDGAAYPDSPSYYFHCPGAEGPLGGMSGGPARNGAGEVIGVFTAFNPLNNVAAVTPISVDSSGVAKIGFQRTERFSRCYRDFGLTGGAKPCQVIPGLTYETNLP